MIINEKNVKSIIETECNMLVGRIIVYDECQTEYVRNVELWKKNRKDNSFPKTLVDQSSKLRETYSYIADRANLINRLCIALGDEYVEIFSNTVGLCWIG